jgi:hypothetical protein
MNRRGLCADFPMPRTGERIRLRIELCGAVQGVGLRSQDRRHLARPGHLPRLFTRYFRSEQSLISLSVYQLHQV